MRNACIFLFLQSHLWTSTQGTSYIIRLDIVAQSICTHYSCFENQGWFVTLKKNWASCFFKKQGAKNQGHCYSKREEATWSLLFLNNNDPVFLHPTFCKKQGPWYFKSSRPWKNIRSTWKIRIVGADWLSKWRRISKKSVILGANVLDKYASNWKCGFGM